jgi:hypothetical protein
MCQAANCQRRPPTTAARAAETVEVHTKYYASDRRMVTGAAGWTGPVRILVAPESLGVIGSLGRA